MSRPTDKFQVGGEKWRCCNYLRRSAYCPECGKQRPATQWSSRVDDIIDQWEKEKYVSEKTVQTIQDRISECENVLDQIRTVKTLRDLLCVMQECGISPPLLDCVDLEETKKIALDRVESWIFQYRGRKDAQLRRAAQRGYWIETVRELVALIPKDDVVVGEQTTIE